MLIRLLGLLTTVVILMTSAWAQDRVDLNPYFKNLDYFKPANRKQLLNYEAEFLRYMQKTLEKDESELTREDGKTLLYGTLFMSNTNQGMRFKQLAFEDVVKNGRLDFEGCGDEKGELIAREELILASLRLAKKLMPDDYRLDTWIGGHELYHEELTKGAVTDETFNKMYELSKKDQFSYTALAIVSRDLKLSLEQEKKMVELAQLVSDRQIPCVKNEAGKCFDSKIAPHTTQVGRLLTGDIFLRDASHYVEEGKVDIEGRRIKSGVSARVIYGMIKRNKVFDWTNIYIRGRVKAVNKLLWKEKAVGHGLTDSLNYQKSYSCTACHGR